MQWRGDGLQGGDKRCGSHNPAGAVLVSVNFHCICCVILVLFDIVLWTYKRFYNLKTYSRFDWSLTLPFFLVQRIVDSEASTAEDKATVLPVVHGTPSPGRGLRTRRLKHDSGESSSSQRQGAEEGEASCSPASSHSLTDAPQTGLLGCGDIVQEDGRYANLSSKLYHWLWSGCP